MSGYKTPTFTRFGLMPQGAPCPGILDRMDLKDWPRRQGYSAGCLDGYCQVIFFYRICTLPFPSLACDTYIYRYYFTTFIWSWNLLQALNTQFFKIENELKFFFSIIWYDLVNWSCLAVTVLWMAVRLTNVASVMATGCRVTSLRGPLQSYLPLVWRFVIVGLTHEKQNAQVLVDEFNLSSRFEKSDCPVTCWSI